MNKYLFVLLLIVGLASCQTIDIFEKTTAFKTHNWKSAERPSFTFEIQDTTSLYKILLVLRHEDAYNYNNIWVKLVVKGPATVDTIRREFILGNNKQGWLGSGMDDVFEHRIPFNDKPAPLKRGKYTFILQQDMREDPLEHIMNVGIRVEKVK
ncbi:gliding motility lipoprotein GldH [Segetibacter koreensis]|uniref:gliding motility lipoprotein GldH n=1 Tax=Segetibacter koreensis TaxID=398037 RepID=UPI00037C5970|nr:gliding motility lipoprotein GldH [Segetibacter koreensis]